jgi:hypothetical protein
MSEFMEKAKDFEDKHDAQVDQGVEKLGDQVDKRTGGEHTDTIDKAEDQVERHD